MSAVEELSVNVWKARSSSLWRVGMAWYPAYCLRHDAVTGALVFREDETEEEWNGIAR